jgi:aldose sugar dehydrogenase
MSKTLNRISFNICPNLFVAYALFLILFLGFNNSGYAYFEVENDLIKIADSNLKVEKFVEGLERPTTVAFIGPNDILVLEKDRGTVRRIENGVILREPLLDLNVANRHERGMLGIAVARDENWVGEKIGENRTTKNPSYVFLYFTKGETRDGEDNRQVDDDRTFRNSMYRYQLVNNNTKLINPKLLFQPPPTDYTFHNGGTLLIGPDRSIYVGIGDLTQPYKSQAQNAKNGTLPLGTGGILIFTQDGETAGGVSNGILGNTHPTDKYYAYGIRNSFGMDFDPVTGKLWDTENGPYYGDEINIVEPGFNSGWSKVQGIWQPTKNLTAGDLVLNPNDLTNFNQKGMYSLPEFIWKQPVGATAVKFFNSDKLGEEYRNDLFVGDINNGYLYHFDLVKNRTSLNLDDGSSGPLADKVADTASELKDVIFGKGFGGITDIEVGPYDGYLYVVSHRQGAIFRIVPIDEANDEKS